MQLDSNKPEILIKCMITLIRVHLLPFNTRKGSYQPLLTLTERTWSLKPSACMLTSSESAAISLPSSPSSPNNEMDGTEKLCSKRDGAWEPCQKRSNQCFVCQFIQPWPQPWRSGWRCLVGSPCLLMRNSLLLIRHTWSLKSLYSRREPSWKKKDDQFNFRPQQFPFFVYIVAGFKSLTFLQQLCRTWSGILLLRLPVYSWRQGALPCTPVPSTIVSEKGKLRCGRIKKKKEKV